jgi:3-methyladenine DNA glycosylase AlkD
MQANQILKKLKSQANPQNVAGMTRFGINPQKTYGINLPVLRKMAKEIGRDHRLALKLWDSGIHEARILASMIDEAEKVSEKQMEKWVKDLDSWDVCDQVCSNLFDKTEFAYQKAFEWSKRKEEFIKRAGFVLMAALSVHDKEAKDKKFEQFFPIIKKEVDDKRNFVKKAVNWSLRQIGKRNSVLNKKAIVVAKEIQKMDFQSAKWIANDALRELKSEAIQKRFIAKK